VDVNRRRSAASNQRRLKMPEPTTTTPTSPKAKATVPKTAELSAAIREDVIASVKQAQQFTLDAMSTWVDVIGKVAPELPTVPFVPARSDVVEGVGTFFEMAGELLESQRKFALDLVGVLVPSS
jgi:hypothetical protein